MAHRYLTTSDLADMQRTARPAFPAGTAGTAGARSSRGDVGGGPAVHSITSTPEGRSKDMGRRMKVYTVQMALRVACFFGFVFVDNWWLRIAFVLGMVLFPWSAVLLANAGADKSERESSYLGPDSQQAAMLTSAPEPSAEEAPEEGPAQEEPTVVEGQWTAHPGATPER